MPQIKICGITRIEETEYLNQQKVDYAGFVFFEKSRRNVSLEQAKQLCDGLDKEIQKVAVTVSPDADMVKQIEAAGFDLIQIHGELRQEAVAACKLPIWRAINISNLEEAIRQLETEENYRMPGWTGMVVDGAEYGSGKTFSWKDMSADETAGKEVLQKLKTKTFILAGGLNVSNVAEGIRLFSPDVVDVSSGVEGIHGKEKEKIEEFVREVRKNG